MEEPASLTYRISIPDDAGPALYILTATADWKGVTSGSAAKAVSIRARD